MKKLMSIILAAMLALGASLMPIGDFGVSRAEAEEHVELFGYATYDFGSDMSNDCKWISFNTADPSAVTGYNAMPDTVAAAYYEGMVYGYHYTVINGALDTSCYKMDHETREVMYFEGDHEDGVYGMAYDYTRGKMFGLCGRNENRKLGIIDLETGGVEYVADFTGAPEPLMTFAIDGEGNGYALTSNATNSTLVRIDLDTAECTVIGTTGVPLSNLQSMTWDHGTNRLYWAQVRNTTTLHGLYVVDVETGEATSLGVIGDGMELTGLYSTAQPSVAPGVPGDIDLDGAVTAGDAVLALRAAMGLVTLEGMAFENADLDGDGEITTADAVLVLRKSLGILEAVF